MISRPFYHALAMILHIETLLFSVSGEIYPINEEGHRNEHLEMYYMGRLVHCTTGPEQLFQSVSLRK